MTRDTEKSYNGWLNYETWSVALLINNEQGTHNEARRMSRGIEEDYELADALKEWVETDEVFGVVQVQDAPLACTLAAQLLSGALSEVDWFEIARSLREVDADTRKEVSP